MSIRGHQLNGSCIAIFAAMLDKGKPTRFRFEGAFRHCIRSFLVLQGETWRRMMPRHKFSKPHSGGYVAKRTADRTAKINDAISRSDRHSRS
jgi:hypothetical protein